MSDIRSTNQPTTHSAASTKKAGKKPKKVLSKILFSLLIIALIATSAFFAVKYFELKNNPGAAIEKETKSLEVKIGKLISLPKDETPTVATVEDKEKLKDQPFFAEAENGDKIVIYTNAKKAIIYREKENKIINVGPIAMDSTPQADEQKSDIK